MPKHHWPEHFVAFAMFFHLGSKGSLGGKNFACVPPVLVSVRCSSRGLHLSSFAAKTGLLGRWFAFELADGREASWLRSTLG